MQRVNMSCGASENFSINLFGAHEVARLMKANPSIEAFS
jgi:hypothetical protein